MVWQLARKGVSYLLLIAGAVLTTLPLLFMIATALKANVYIIETPPQFIPQHPTMKNFIDAWSLNNFGLFFTNSLIVAISTTILSVLLSAMMAYAFARFTFPGKTLFFYSLLLTLMNGYDNARVVHFWAMAFVVIFLAVHLLMVALVPRTLLTMVRGK